MKEWRMPRPDWKQQIFAQLALILLGLFVILPIWSISRLAFDESLKSRPVEFRVLPKDVGLAPMKQVLQRPYQSVTFSNLLKNSLSVALSSALAAVFFGMSMAYAFARFRFPGRRTGLFLILLTAMLPPIAFTTPLYVVLSILKIRTTLLGLAIIYATFAMPFCVWNMRAAFQMVPKELEEAAYLDGASNLRTFLSISLPLAIPSIAVSALIAFLMGYSEFAIGWLFIDKSKNVTLAMSIYSILASGAAQPWSQIGSLALVMSIPVVIIFIILQRTLLEQMLLGNTGESG
jgi:arabinogalactan oligomer/maltooligosaccharide transport system permease protein